MFDVIIIGGGPAGYLGAERLAQKGKKVLLVENQFIGGTCLNVGCIPTKSLLNSAKHFIHAKDSAQFGVHTSEVEFNFTEMMTWKNKTISTLVGGVTSKLKKLGIEIITGTGQVIDAKSVKITETEEVFEAKAILLATGSISAMPNIPGANDNPYVIDSTALLNCEEVPESLCIIGGGVIGIEFASLFSMLGSKVSVVEMMDEIIPSMDKDHSPILRKALTGVDFYLSSTVEKIDQNTVFFKSKDGKEESIQASTILMAIGRNANLETCLAKESNLDISKEGVIVDDNMKTSIPGIWAAGDINGKSMLAHSAYRMAEVAVTDICNFLDGKNTTENEMHYNAIPWVVYSNPEVAGCGITEQEALKNGIEIKAASVPMIMSGRFIAENGLRAPGTVKVIASKNTDKILGIHILGAYASEIIWGASSIIEKGITVQEMKEMIFPHPTVSEVIREAIWMM